MRRLRDLALASMLSAGLYAAMVVAPAGAAVLVWLVPFPGLLLAALRPRDAKAWLLATCLLLGLVASVAPSFGFAITVGVATLFIAAGITRSWTLEATVTGALSAWSIGMAAVYLVNQGGWASAVAGATAQVEEAFAVALEASRAAGANEDALILFEQQRATLVQSVLEVLPALVILTGGAILSANIAIVRRFTPLFGGFRLRYWRAPDGLIWAFIVAGFGMFAPIDLLSLVATNVFVVLLGCYFMQGLAVVSYYLDRFGVPTSLRVGIYVLIAIQQLLTAVVLALGIFDLWGDFRRLHTDAADASLPSDGD